MLARFFALLALPLVCLANPTQQQFAALAAKNNGVIKLDSALYDALTASNREWSAVVQLTAMGDQFKCAPCKEFDPNFNAVAKAWQNKVPADKRDTHFFATLDFAEGRDVFTRLGLNSAPFVNFFPIEQGPNKKPGKQSSWSYDFNSLSFDALIFAREISKHTIVPVPYSPPPNYALYANIAAVGFLGALAARFAYAYLGDIIISRWTWAFGVVVIMLTFTSGHMFVKIRGMPQTVRGQWMAGGYQNQYGMETNVISIVYGTLTFALLMLILGVPRAKSPSSQRMSVYIFSAMLVVVYSMLVSLFRLKNPSYPFRMLF